jgi:hypothetical protein
MLSQGQVRVADSSSLDTTGSAEAPHALGSLSILEIVMKKLIAVAVLTLASVPAMAQHYHHGWRGYHHHHHHHRSPNWGPVIGGAILGAVIYDIYNRPVVVQQPPVIVQTPPVITQYPVQNCTPWTETQNPDGSITRSRTCTQ